MEVNLEAIKTTNWWRIKRLAKFVYRTAKRSWISAWNKAGSKRPEVGIRVHGKWTLQRGEHTCRSWFSMIRQIGSTRQIRHDKGRCNLPCGTCLERPETAVSVRWSHMWVLSQNFWLATSGAHYPGASDDKALIKRWTSVRFWRVLCHQVWSTTEMVVEKCASDRSFTQVGGTTG